MAQMPFHIRLSVRRSSHLLDRYIMRSLLWPTLRFAGLLLVVMLMERGLRLLQEMSALGLPARHLGPLLLRLIPYYAQQALPFGFVLAVILVLSRMGRNREWEAMAAAGVSPVRIALVMMLLAFAIAAATLLISGFLEPLGRHDYRRLRAAAVNEARIGAIQPGAIYDQIPGVMVTAVRKQDGMLEQVFLKLAQRSSAPLLVTARSARLSVTNAPGAVNFELQHGELLIAGTRQVRFAKVHLYQPIELEQTRWLRGRDARELTVLELARRPAESAQAQRRNLAELYGKIARALGLLALPWLALPLLAGSRGERRWLAIATILFLVVAYYHGVNLSRNLAASGELVLGQVAAATALLPLVASLAIWRIGSAVRPHAARRLTLKLPRWPVSEARCPRFRRTPPVQLPAQLLTRYLAGRLTRMTVAVLAGLVLLLQVVDLLERGETLVNAGQGLAGFCYYAWLRLPATLIQAGPLAMLGGGVLALALLRSGNELVAVQSLGISAIDILRRLLIVPLCLGLLLVLVSETWSPKAQVAFSEWWAQISPADPLPDEAERRWFRIGADLVETSVSQANPARLHDVRIYQVDWPHSSLGYWIRADAADWNRGEWTLHRVSRWDEGTGLQGGLLASARWQTTLTPTRLARFLAAPVPLTGHDAWLARRTLAPGARADRLYDARIYMTASLMIAPLLMLLLATTLVVVPRQEVALTVCLFQAATAGLAYLLLDGWLQVLGQTEALAPAAAVIIAPLLFGVLAMEIILRSAIKV